MLQPGKGYSQKHTANNILNGQRLIAFPLWLGAREDTDTHPCYFNTVLEIPASKLGKKKKGIKMETKK